MSEPVVMWLNNRAIGEVHALEGWADGIQYDRESVPVADLLGHFPALSATAQPRTIRVTLWVGDETLDSRYPALDELDALTRGLCEIRFSDSPDRVARGIVTRKATQAFASDASWVDGSADILRTLEIVCHSPVKVARYGSVVGLSTSRTPVPLGTLPSGGLLLLYGTDQTVTYRGASGEPLATMGFTFTPSNSHLEIDLTRQMVTEVEDDGTRTNAADALTSGDFFALDPGDGDYVAGSWPTLELSSGTGALIYRRSYES